MLESKFYPWGPEHKDMMRESPLRDHTGRPHHAG